MNINFYEEMNYQNGLDKPIVLADGYYQNHKFVILSFGSHPTAYVECKLEDCDDYMSEKRLEIIDVHGGFTYYGYEYWCNCKEKKFLGWDYAHAGDLYYYDGIREMGDKKWSVVEIISEVMDVINQLKVVEKFNKQKEYYYL